ncbi:MAG: CBS domain-containing protein [Deltaproteobacteria bacterium]|nr:CBS domain-containing protein [Deltaproteobacteria bacterium]
MDEPRAFIPFLRDIMVPSREIYPDVKVREVVEMFQNDHSLLVLPLVDGGAYVGSITRKNLFFRHLSRKFAADLFSNKPVAVLMDENPVLMEPRLDITSALARLLEYDPLLETDCFLIVDGERCLGVVTVSDLMMRISESQRNLLDTLQTLSARIQEEVAHASRIQQELLPDPAFSFNGITVAAGITTSTEIGGDFYDYFPCGDNRLGLIIADVSGHGVQSGMVTTAAKASLHTLLSSGVSTAAELLAGMNRAIIATARRRLLMTCFIAVIDTETKSLSYANAGHNFPYRYRGQSSELELLQEASGFPLGFDEGARFLEYSMEFDRGDSLVLYTDGIVECWNGDEEEFGYERMERLIMTAIGGEPDVLVRVLLEDAREFAGTGTLEDDATVLVASFPC